MPYISTPERIGIERGRSERLIERIAALLRLKFHEPGLDLMPEIRAIKRPQALKT